MQTSKFMCITDVFITETEYRGGGWNLSVIEIDVKIPQQTILTVTTKQTTERIIQDDGVNFEFSNGCKKRTTFENLGRLIACGALKQID